MRLDRWHVCLTVKPVVVEGKDSGGKVIYIGLDKQEDQSVPSMTPPLDQYSNISHLHEGSK
jgi:hypothetical protein